MNKLKCFAYFLSVFTVCLNAQTNLDVISKSLVKFKVNKTEKLDIDSTSNVQFDFSYGSGFYISKNGLILTAYHVIEKMSPLNKSPISGYDLELNRSFGLTLVFVDKDNDIALLQNPYFTQRGKEKQFYINILNFHKDINYNAKCICIGFPNCIQEFGQIFALSIGSIINTQTDLDDYKKNKWKKNLIVSSNEVISGFSGGLAVDFKYTPIGMILASGFKQKKSQTYIKSFDIILNSLIDYEEFLK